VSVIALVPARCGSKSIRLKNIKPFCGRPLIFWSLQALEKATEIDKVFVATDCAEIADVVTGFGFNKTKIYHRDASNAQDGSSTENLMLEFLEQADAVPEDLLLLVQATSPFTQASDFDSAVDQLRKSDDDSLLSCAKVKRFFWDVNGKPINYDNRNRPLRQQFEGSFIENGAFYLHSIGGVMRAKNRLGDKVTVYEMPEYSALELDEDDDWFIGEYFMRKYVLKHPPVPKIKLFLSDVDGVLTDAGMYYTENGDEIKKFSTYDGMGFHMIQAKGIKVGIITKEDRKLNQRRADKLKLDYSFHGIDDKLTVVKELCKKLAITLEEVAYIGDDVNDMELLSHVGFPACPYNATTEIRSLPGIMQLKRSGGQGAVRELAEYLLAYNLK